MSALHDIIDPWLREEGSEDLETIAGRLDWLKGHLLADYEPSPYRRFDERLADWLRNLPEEADRKTLFRLLGHLFFLGKPQFQALCRTTFENNVVRWLIDTHRIPLDDPDLDARIADEVRHTWFNGVTDSMNLNMFIKVNGLVGHDKRFDWRSLSAVGKDDAIRGEAEKSGVRSIVLLEDFVGGGEQMVSAIQYARKVLPDIPMLVAPLICCPDGVEGGRALARRHNLQFQPTLRLREKSFLPRDAVPGEPPVFTDARELVKRVADRLGEWREDAFGHHDTGAIVAMYTNCPDNTLAIIHEDGDDWKALFPRIRR